MPKNIRKGEAVRTGYEFEREVAAIYRALGASVEVDVGLAGSQIDILVRESTPSGTEIKTVVECKHYSRPVGIEPVLSFASVSQLLRQRGLIDGATLVSQSGFSRHAREAASAHGVQLLELDDLLQRTKGIADSVATAEKDIDAQRTAAAQAEDRPGRVFVIMPFSTEFEDVYLLGVREVAERLGVIVERGDDIEHNENIIDVIQGKIRSADAVVADTTGSNPNVFYEIGYAHAVSTPTIMISRRGSIVAFDLRSMNHIFYETIVELRERLEARLRTTLGLSTDGAKQ